MRVDFIYVLQVTFTGLWGLLNVERELSRVTPSFLGGQIEIDILRHHVQTED